MAAECYVSLKRIEGVLSLDDLDAILEKTDRSSSDETVSAQNLKAKFYGSNEYFFLDLEFSINAGELVGIVGPVGSGKSSFLSLFTGGMKLSGDLVFPDTVAVCPQEPWIIADTVRENILLGRDLDKNWYQKVVTSCCLLEDFDSFSKGDLTVVGERGVTLSGGQRARINLARAVYKTADLYLLDLGWKIIFQLIDLVYRVGYCS